MTVIFIYLLPYGNNSLGLIKSDCGMNKISQQVRPTQTVIA